MSLSRRVRLTGHEAAASARAALLEQTVVHVLVGSAIHSAEVTRSCRIPIRHAALGSFSMFPGSVRAACEPRCCPN